MTLLTVALCSMIFQSSPVSIVYSAWLGRLADAPPLEASAPAEIGEWRSIKIKANPIGQDIQESKNEPETTSLVVGSLTFRGGLTLTSEDKAFGGFSGLRFHPTDGKLYAVSDRTQWFRTDPIFDASGAIKNLANAEMATMMRYNGELLTGLAGDAEGLEFTNNGDALVSFERHHRIDLYNEEKEKMLYAKRIFHNRLTTKGLKANGGLEAISLLSDGRILALAEDTVELSEEDETLGSLITKDERPGWISTAHVWQQGSDDWRPLSYKTAPEFSVTDMAQDDTSGDVFVLERAFSRSKGARARITRIPLSEILQGRVIEGEELARFSILHGIDNMEGIDVKRQKDGRLMIYIISDDNFNLTQRTLLMSWEVLEERDPQ